ncbi:hypothetical protein [Halobacillus amylolyticus]|uniref:Uncharacterized protein n=1 Tax=Halobacillus amylolyticus TaxID=2932259 RepID=A0ABY4H9J9_9BACI|nr:hypothetical protein [Halobacillus amylolyticus]UOR11556.1 hypothetical protein MUO15_18550 [Halobacillus amylolyticus]
MVNILINHIPSTLLHLLAGSLIMYSFFGKKTSPFRERVKIFSLGILVLIPDIPKLTGGTIGHSLFVLPLLAFGLAFLVKKITKEPLLKSWVATMITLGLGALFIDLIGNGARPLSPFNGRIVSFTIIQKELWLIFLLLVIFFVTLLYNNKLLLIISLLITGVLLAGKAYSKIELENRLQAKYEEETIHLLVTKPEANLGLYWNFSVVTDQELIKGTSPIWLNDIEINHILDH